MTFQLIGGGAEGSIGGHRDLGPVADLAGSPSSACSSTTGASGGASASRSGPIWAEVLLAVLGVLVVFGARRVANTNYLAEWPRRAATRRENNIASPTWRPADPVGIPVADPYLVAVTSLMTFIANRRKFGRYVYAYGGNPEAAELGGINTRWTIMKTVHADGPPLRRRRSDRHRRGSTARRSTSGQSNELYVIAAAVVGGTSFAGGIGTIPGAVLGAFVMQSLAYGLAFIGVNSPTQNVVAGIVLVVAVGFDT